MATGVPFFPQTLPPNSIVGRVSPTAGATEAIPLATLAAAMNLTVGSGAGLVSFTQAGVGAILRTLQLKLQEFVSVLDFGAVGDGVTDDSVNIQKAINSLTRGGQVFFPSTGAAYLIGTGLVVPNGVTLFGTACVVFPGMTATIAQWTAQGSWIQSTDTVNPAVTLSGNGASIGGINFIYTQPVPSGGSFTPTTYPYAIKAVNTFFQIEDIIVIAGTHGIQLSPPSGSGGGTFSSLRNAYLSTFNVGLYTNFLNDTVKITNVHARNLYYELDSRVYTYNLNNLIGWDCRYTDNVMVDGFEVLYAAVALKLTDDTCLGNTHSLFNATIHGFQASLCRAAIQVASSTTTVRAYFSNFLGQSSDQGSFNDTLFQLGSDNVNVKMSNLTVPSARGQFAVLGNGTGGFWQIDDLEMAYNTATTSQVGFSLATASVLNIGNKKITRGGTTPGLIFAGGGYYNILSSAYCQWTPFGDFGLKTGTCNGSNQDASSDNQLNPIQLGCVQGRISGSINITVSQAASSVALFVSGFPEITKTGIPSTGTGFQVFDSGWLDLTSVTQIMGRFRINGTTGVQWALGPITAEFR